MLTGLVLAATSGCRPQTARHQAELFVFGTLVEIQLYGLSDAASADAIQRIEQDFQQLHRDWHAWEPGLLTDLNSALASGHSAPVHDDLTQLLQRAEVLERRSWGTFNPAIGNLIRLWGFHTSEFPIDAPPPSAAQIRYQLSQAPSLRSLRIADGSVSGDNPAVRIDLGGIAKGAAVDRAIERLRQAGASAALVNAGGDLRAFGRPDQRSWRVAVRHPDKPQVLATIDVAGDEAIFTSGNYSRFRADATGPRYGHIIDPRSGWPVTEIVSATVIAGDGTLADAAATALVVAGPAQWRQVSAGLGIELALLADHRGCLLMTPAMAARVELLAPDQCAGQDPPG